jgi:WD40 repeat protein/tetratricopeptide (TPR) repeat protein
VTIPGHSPQSATGVRKIRLAFQPAFAEKERNRLIKQMAHQDPVRLGKQNRQVPHDLETIVHKAIDKDPSQRYASAGALAEDLQRFIEDEPIKARRVSAVERLRRWCRRNPLLAATTGLAAAELLAVTLVSSYLAIAQANFAAREARSNDDLRREHERTEAALQKSTQLGVELDSKLRELRKNSALAAVERGQSLIDQGQVRRGLLWLTRGLELAPADDPDLQHTIRTNLASLRGELAIPLATFAHPHIIAGLALSPDGRTVALRGSGTMQGEVRLYDAATRAQIGPPLPHQGPIFAMAFSTDSKTLLTGDTVLSGERKEAGNNSELRFWDVATGKESCPPLDLQGTVSVGAFSPDGKILATQNWGDDGFQTRLWNAQTRLWDVAARQPIGQPIGHGRSVIFSLAISPDGKTLATANGTTFGPAACRLWDVATGKPRGDPLPHPLGIAAVTFSPDNKTIATTGGQDMKARLWDASSGQMKGKPFEHGGQVFAVTFSPDGRFLLTAGGGFVHLWDANTGQPVGEPPGGLERRLTIPFSTDGQSILIPGDDQTARLWSLPLGRQTAPPLPQSSGVSALALSGDGKHMLVRSGDSAKGELRLWDTILDKPSGPAVTHEGWYYAADLSPDGKTILTGSMSAGVHTARLWDGVSGKPIGQPLRCSGQVYGVAFSPDGKTILVGGGDSAQNGEVQLADAASGKAIGPPLVLPKPVWAVAFSPDGKTFLTGNGDDLGGQSGEVRLWDAGTRLPIGTPLRHRGRVCALAFSPDGTIFASGSRDRTARLWNAATSKPIGLPLVHRGEVNALAFSPDGKIVATASDDQTAQFWNATTGRPIGRPLRHHGPVNSVAFTRDGTTLITASDDKNIRFWQVPAPLAGAVEEIKAWAEVTSSMVLSPDGTLGELEASALNARLEKLMSEAGQPLAVGNPFAAAAGHGLTYHLRQALACMETEEWQAALWHLDREIDAQRGSWLAHVLRTKALVQLGRQDQAAADFTKAFALGSPERVLSWYHSYVAESAGKQHWQTVFCYLDHLIAARPQEAALYLERAEAYLKRNQWQEAVKDYDEAVKWSPNEPQVWRDKGTFDCNHGRWQEAAKAMKKALELDPSYHWDWYQTAPLLLHIGDVDGFRRHCRDMLQRFGQTDEPLIAERTAKVCLLLPDAVADQNVVQRLAQRAVTGTEKNLGYGWFQLAKGLAEYRAGQFERSIEWLRESQKDRYASLGGSKALAHLFLAMAQHRLGRADEARAELTLEQAYPLGF